MKTITNSKAIAGVTTALFIGSLFWLVGTKRVNSSLETGLSEEKLKSETLLSEKLLLEKEIEKFKDQLIDLKVENGALGDRVKTASDKLQHQEAEYNRMKRENMSLGQIRKQRQELQALKNQLDNEITTLRASYAALEAKNAELNNVIASLEERNSILTSDLNRAMFAAIDQSQVSALRKSEKLTVRAKRTKKLIANFEVPANLKTLSFRIVDPKGNTLSSQQGNIAFTSAPSKKSFTASTNSTEEGRELQNVQMVYLPKDRLKTGIYTIEILNENLYVGSLKVKLN